MENSAELQDLVSKVAKEELREDEKSREQNLRLFRDWIAQNSDIKNCRTDDNFLLRFLRVRKFNLPMAQKSLLKFLRLPHTFPFLEDVDIRDPAVDAIISQGVEFGAPIRDEKNRQLIVLNVGKIDPTTNRYQDFMRANNLNCCTLMEDQTSQVMGFVYVVNGEGIGLRHTTFWPPIDFAKHTVALQTVFPMRFKEIHVVNLPGIVRWFFDFFVSVSTEKMQKRIFVHKTVEDLHKAVNSKLLPEELGGTMPMKSMIELWKRKIEEHREEVLELHKIQLQEIEKESNGDLDVFGIQGSFKTLCVD